MIRVVSGVFGKLRNRCVLTTCYLSLFEGTGCFLHPVLSAPPPPPSGYVSDELPLNVAAEVHCLKGTTPKTTEKEETAVAAVQTRPSEGYVSLTRFLCRSFLKRGLINWQKRRSGPKPKRVSPLESAPPLTVELALRDMWKTSESNATDGLGRA